MCAAPAPKRRKLSDKLKNMRFMKRREEADLRVKLLNDQVRRERDDHWVADHGLSNSTSTLPLVIIEEGFGDDPHLGRHTRRSYGGFNPLYEVDPLLPTAKVRTLSNARPTATPLNQMKVPKREPLTMPLSSSSIPPNNASSKDVDLSIARSFTGKHLAPPSSRKRSSSTLLNRSS